MAKEFKMPELNSVVIVGNLTKDPVFRQTMRGTPVVNFTIASNRRFRDSKRQWKEDVCFVGVVAWNKLAESCRGRLKKSSAVLVEGELQSRNLKTADGRTRTVVEIKARRIQFLDRRAPVSGNAGEQSQSSSSQGQQSDALNKYLSNEEPKI
ncbi:single-strand binding protein [Candidatus Kryptonium thompsonii]|jgi:single-strand DNA-binding protein|uniref:Single-stranded DNA-binding protein n=1 Tax=Candidatus Kryptonium thompsonii TaxID=1633631 RepID=A0A0P1P892_9BACT|nr:single-stranded DNA-binding protein [Candidatus Kryptonium thompsoni]CUS76361.1 single-strand binding protein [Candidatus Kryptonium thompsoni]CUS78223.1 single-strand binding protein [Candidatus Kryptonium thompsoni]CUS80520.1 single-strand binding protein [Candidatus Kryptonium thompsoni]CUS81963.1 single-strand binding protein [Candidatus Kryptonium thompsoni]CUS91180.1 single-strand binding protein [Candidatus Kryptonium thompsoni]